MPTRELRVCVGLRVWPGILLKAGTRGLFFVHDGAVSWHKPAVDNRVSTEVKAFENMSFDPAWGLASPQILRYETPALLAPNRMDGPDVHFLGYADAVQSWYTMC